jgi:C1A family cysteine protease
MFSKVSLITFLFLITLSLVSAQTCPSGCECLDPSYAQKYGYDDCYGKETPCGNGDYCYHVPVEDSDNDGIPDAQDNCPDDPNQGQQDTDGDGIGDVCDDCDDRDDDSDGVVNCEDDCPNEKEVENGVEDGDGCPDDEKYCERDRDCEYMPVIYEDDCEVGCFNEDSDNECDEDFEEPEGECICEDNECEFEPEETSLDVPTIEPYRCHFNDNPYDMECAGHCYDEDDNLLTNYSCEETSHGTCGCVYAPPPSVEIMPCHYSEEDGGCVGFCTDDMTVAIESSLNETCQETSPGVCECVETEQPSVEIMSCHYDVMEEQCVGLCTDGNTINMNQACHESESETCECIESGSGGSYGVDISPRNPEAGDEVTIIVDAFQDVEIIEIWEGGKQRENCTTKHCEYETPPIIEQPDFTVNVVTEGEEDLTADLATIHSGGLWIDLRALWPDLTPSCSDSDGGIAPYSPGHVINESGRREGDTIYLPPMHYDECINSTHMREYYCNGSNVESVIRPCPACVVSPETVDGIKVRGDWCPCYDSDGGMNYFTEGYIMMPGGMVYDQCTPHGNAVIEYYCDEDNEPANRTVSCEFTRETSYGDIYTRTSACIDGACPCEDSDGGLNYYERGVVPSPDFEWSRDSCTTEGPRGMLEEFYTSVEVVRWDELGNPVYHCYIRDEQYECEGECWDGACGPSCYDGVENQGEEGVDCGGPCIPCMNRYPCEIDPLPTTFDWRDYNILPEIRDQASCGSCWAFSALGTTEAKYNLERSRNSTLPDLSVNLSEQSLVSDCMSGSCTGGWHNRALKYTRDTGTVDEACLPYTSQRCLDANDTCVATCDCGSECSDPCSCSSKCGDWSTRLWHIEKYDKVSNKVDKIKEALICHGPLAVATDNWNHAIVLVAYNDTSGNWTIRNSWGAGWGDNGYGDIPYSGHSYSDLRHRVYYAEGVIPP